MNSLLRMIPACRFRGLIKSHGSMLAMAASTKHPLDVIKLPDIPLPKDGSNYQPAMLHLVTLIKQIKGRPYWEKNILKEFKLDGKLHNGVILKNTPLINNKLWKIKHMIRIRPITFPDGLPPDGDITGTVLKQTGEFIFRKKLQVDPKLLLEDPKPVKELDRDTIRKHLKMRWLSGYT